MWTNLIQIQKKSNQIRKISLHHQPVGDLPTWWIIPLSIGDIPSYKWDPSRLNPLRTREKNLLIKWDDPPGIYPPLTIFHLPTHFRLQDGLQSQSRLGREAVKDQVWIRFGHRGRLLSQVMSEYHVG